MTARWMLPLALVGCGAQQRDLPEIVLARPPSTSVRAFVEGGSPVVRERLELRDSACDQDSRTLYADDEGTSFRLCDRALEHCYAEVESIQTSKMRFSIVPGERPQLFVAIPYRGLELRGFVDGSRTMLFPAGKPPLLGGFLRPGPLRLVSAKDNQIIVAGSADPGIVPRVPLQSVALCDALSFGQDNYTGPEEIEASVGARGPGINALLGGSSVPLSASPGSAPLAELSLGLEGEVKAYQTEGDARFIVRWGDSGQIFGWVPRRQLRAQPQGGTYFGSSGSGHGFAAIPTSWRGVSCAHPVQLFARMSVGLFSVGEVEVGRTFSLGAPQGQRLIAVQLRHQRYSDFADPPMFRTPESIRLLEGAELVVLESELSDCQRGVLGEPSTRSR